MRVLAACAALVVLAAACDTSDDTRPASAPADDAHARADSAAHATAAPDADAHHHTGANEADAQPLLPIMRQLAIDMAAMQQALWVENFEEVETRAHAVAEHAPIAADEIARIQQTLGGDMAEFERLDTEVHEAAVRMHEASRARDLDALAEHLATVQRGCIECHARFRERLRTTAS